MPSLPQQARPGYRCLRPTIATREGGYVGFLTRAVLLKVLGFSGLGDLAWPGNTSYARGLGTAAGLAKRDVSAGAITQCHITFRSCYPWLGGRCVHPSRLGRASCDCGGQARERSLRCSHTAEILLSTMLLGRTSWQSSGQICRCVWRHPSTKLEGLDNCASCALGLKAFRNLGCL